MNPAKLALIILAGLFTFSAVANQDSPLVAAARAGRHGLGASRPIAPELRTIAWFNSERSSLQAFRGQVVLVDFWATWCGSCVGAHDKIQQLARQLGPQGFAVVLIHSRYTRVAGSSDVPAESVLPSYIAEHHIVVPVAIAAKDEFEQLGVVGIPHYLLVDRRGFIRYTRVAQLPEENEIRKLLAE